MSEIEKNDVLPAFEVVVISGVVAPFGVSGGKAGREKLWRMTFAFDGWRVESSKLQISNLGISRQVTDEELSHFQEIIKPYSVVRIRAEVAAHSTPENLQVQLIEYLGVFGDDAELNARAAELQKPVTFEDSLFGTLTFDRRISWYKGEAVWNNESVRLNLAAETPEELTKSLDAAHSLWREQESWSRKVNDYAVQELLSLKNESWLDEDEGETELTAAEFLERMTLESISVNSDSSFDFWHDDGDLFWGHAIQIGGNLTAGLNSADIPG